VRGDERHHEQVLRRFRFVARVLDAELPRLVRELPGKRQASAVELEERAVPGHHGGRVLGAVGPLSPQVLEHGTRPVVAPRPDEDVREAETGFEAGSAVRARELVCPLGKSNSIAAAAIEANDRERRQRGGRKRIVVESLREVDRSARVLLRGGVSLGEAERQAELLMDGRLQSRLSCSLAKRLTQQRDRAPQVFVLQAGHEDESVGPGWAGRRPPDEIAHEHSRPLDLSRVEMRARS